MDIICERSTQNRYFVASRELDIAELKLLIDAVESSKFITEKKSSELVEKLQKQASIYSKNMLKRNIKAYSRFKPDHEDVLYTADLINRAINEGKKISFTYYHYNVRKEKKLKNGGKPYIFSPYYLIWDGDCYYMVGYSEKHKAVGNFRVDRIAGIPDILPETAIKAPEGFDINELFLRYTTVAPQHYGNDSLYCEQILKKNIVNACKRGCDEIKTATSP